MKRKLLCLSGLLALALATQGLKAQEKANLATFASTVKANYTSSWNSIGSLNDGVIAYSGGSNNKVWGCWKGSTNDPVDTLTYLWEAEYPLSSSTIHFWTDKEQSAGGSTGVTIPDSWKLQYESEGEWYDVELLDGETYPVVKGEPNTVNFTTVNATGLRAIINTFLNASGNYEAVCVAEWEVYSDDEKGVAYANYLKYYNQLQNKIEELADTYTGIVEELEDASLQYEDITASSSLEDITAAADAMSALLGNVEKAQAAATSINANLNKVVRIIEYSYPGKDKLATVYEDISNFIEEAEGASADFIAKDSILTAAIREYYLSQEATADSPADYSFFITAPNMVKEDAEPTINADGTFEYPNVANYTQGSVPADADGTNWYKGVPTTYGGLDQRYNYNQGRVCWNAWASNFDSMDFFQNLTDLPDGYYTVSADMCTQDGYESTQHVYGTSSTETVVSPNLSGSVYVSQSPYNGTWVTLTTDKILVNDGKLRIGAASTGESDGGAKGWYLVSHFVLKYYGTVSDDEMAAVYNAKIEELKAQADTMKLAADKATYLDSIAAYSGAKTAGEMSAALLKFAEFQSAAESSISKYESFMSGAYATISDSIESKEYSASGLEIAGKAVAITDAYLASSGATYKDIDTYAARLNALSKTYLPVLSTAEEADFKSEAAKEVLSANVKSQTKLLTATDTLYTSAQLDELRAELETALSVAKVADLYAASATDYTSAITNPRFDDAANGWTVYSPNTAVGTYDSSQNYDGMTGKYLNGWTGGTGSLIYNAHQTLSSIPNGKYKLSAIVRTDCKQGTYLYAIADNDSVNGVEMTEVVMPSINYTKYVDPSVKAADGSDSIVYSAVKYGDLWIEAYEATNGGQAEEDDPALADYWNIFNANNGDGHGWSRASLEVEVKDHSLVVGFGNDSTFFKNYGGKAFNGTWLSADNFTLTLISEGDNTDWNPTTGIDEAGADSETPDFKVVDGAVYTDGTVYSISGARVASGEKLAPGVYVIAKGGKAVKIAVK